MVAARVPQSRRLVRLYAAAIRRGVGMAERVHLVVGKPLPPSLLTMSIQVPGSQPEGGASLVLAMTVPDVTDQIELNHAQLTGRPPPPNSK